MAIASQVSRWEFFGDGVTATFGFDNTVFDPDDIKVYVDGALKTREVDYTIALNPDGTGAVTFLPGKIPPAPVDPELKNVVLTRDVPLTQPKEFPRVSAFPAEDVARALDRLTVIAQQLSTRLGRALRLSVSDTLVDLTLPPLSDRINQYLGFNAAGQPIAAAAPEGGNIVSAFMADMLDDADAAEARGTLDVYGTDEVYTQAEVDALVSEAGAWGQCRLSLSGGNLVLLPHNGNKITINGVVETIPDAGVSLAATGATPATNYYIYVYMAAGVPTLERSTTGYATQAGTGVKIKTGDATRTLVGFARAVTGPAWVDSATQRGVRSYFNDPGIAGMSYFSTGRSTTSVTNVQLNSEIQVYVLTWADDTISVSANGSTNNSSSGNVCNSTLVMDGAAVTGSVTSRHEGTGSPNAAFAVAANFSSVAEGWHYFELYGQVGAATGTWSGAAAAGSARTELHVRAKR